MYAVVANGIERICKTQKSLDYILAIYPYPKFTVCRTEEEGREWIRRNQRGLHTRDVGNYGTTANNGFVTVDYIIYGNCIYYNIHLDKAGYLKLSEIPGVEVYNNRDFIKVKVSNVVLDDMMISHHVIAIRRILCILGDYIDVNIIVPDISVYIAVTSYRGSNYILKGAQKEIQSRLGGVSFTVAEGR